MNPSKSPLDSSNWSDLVAGIATDAATLFGKEVELAQIELRNEFRNAKAVLMGIFLGAILGIIGLGLLCAGLALALFAYTTLPQWVCFAVVGGVMVVIGVGFIASVTRSKKKFDLVPQRAVEAMKEDIGWITSTVKTSNAIAPTANKLERR